MFKKRPNIKPLAPLRSSDRRKVADQLIQTYDLSKPPREDATDEEKSSATVQHTELRNLLFPDNIQSAKFTTTHGPDLKQVSGTVYVGGAPGEDARVLWFKLDDTLYPTVYTLWRNPGIVPLLHTPEMVVKKLQGGADLMTPGLAGPPFPPRAVKGATVAIASLDTPSVPAAVGSCLVDVSSLTTVQGQKGHAVQTLHWAGDELWAYSPANKPGRAPPTEVDGWLNVNVEEHLENELVVGTEELSLQDDEDGGVAISKPNDQPANVEVASDAEQNDTDIVETKPLSAKEIEKVFRDAFLFGVHHHKTSQPNTPNHGLEFPLTQSVVMSGLIQPFLPVWTPDDAKQLQIKNTSSKNLKKFLKSLEKDLLIKAKEKPNDTWVVDIDFNDERVLSFKPYRLPKKDPGRSGGTTAASDTSDSSIGQTLQIKTFFKPPERLLPLLTDAEPQHGQLYTASDLKAATTAYLTRENLVSSTNRRVVNLDPTLANALFTGTQSLDKEVLAKGSVPRDALLERVLSASQPWHQIEVARPGDSSTKLVAGKARAGPAPRIKVTLETRSGNKTATRVSGLERFHVAAQPLADELRKVCAGATSVEPLAGVSPKDKERAMEIMVQGPQREAVLKALERRGVRPAWVEVIDKVKKKK